MSILSSDMYASLEKAKVKVYGESETTIEVLFNPSEYKLTDSSEYKVSNIPGTCSPIVSFIYGNVSTLDMSLFFDTSEKLTTTAVTSEMAKDVSDLTKKFTDLVYVKGQIHAPPTVEFIWGSLSFKGVVKQISSSYTMFGKDGKPVRARLELSFMKVMDPNQAGRQSPFESPDRTKCRILTQDKNLWNIAYEEYGDMEKWRLIASANGIMNPLGLSVGMMLKIPAL